MNSTQFNKLDKSFILLKIKDQDCQIKASFYKLPQQMDYLYHFHFLKESC